MTAPTIDDVPSRRFTDRAAVVTAGFGTGAPVIAHQKDAWDAVVAEFVRTAGLRSGPTG